MTNIVNMIFMSDVKRSTTLAAAHQVFIKYGYRKTTMGDLAEAAKISRPALYLLYANKEEIFRAVAVRYFSQVSEIGEQRIATASCLDEKLEAVMQTWVVDTYNEISGSPDAADIYEAGYTIAQDLRKQFSKRYANQILEILKSSEHLDPEMIAQRVCPLERVAILIARSTLGLKREVENLNQLKQHLQDLRKLHLTALEF